MTLKNNDYIIDVYRLRQKLFNLYPEGSTERNRWIQMEQAYTLKKAYEAYSFLISPEAQTLVKKNILFLVTRLLWGATTLYTGVLLIGMISNTVLDVIIGITFGGLFGFLIGQIFKAGVTHAKYIKQKKLLRENLKTLQANVLQKYNQLEWT